MYEYLDSLLAKLKKKLRTEFNRLGMIGFDELNVVNTKKITKEMFDRLLAENEKTYKKAADNAYSSAKKRAVNAGYAEEKASGLSDEWLVGTLMAYNLVTGYVYSKEADRKRMRLNEQILTAREYYDRQLYNTCLQRAANLWWTQSMHYAVLAVDEATIQAYKDLGVKKVRWNANLDRRTCKVCRNRHNKIYEISAVPAKTHYNCRCDLEPIHTEE
jgi:SPP1 gp7 family putative phage head morphogenesis protein